MTILYSFAGCFLAALFASAGYRAISNARAQELRSGIVYKGRIDAIYSQMPQSRMMSAMTKLRHAMVAKSAPYSQR